MASERDQASAQQGIDPRSPVPKHAQVRGLILDAIADLPSHASVPSERVLSIEYGVARMTVRQALELLVTEGRLYRVPGRGTFVAPGKVRLPVRLTSFTTDMSARGVRAGARVLERRTTPAGRVIGRLLELPADANIHIVERLRLADDIPMAIERTHIPAVLAPDLLGCDLEDRSLYQILDHEFGVALDAGEESIEAVAAATADADLLGVPTGSPILLLERVATSGGRPVEYAVSRYRGDRYQLRASLNVPADGGPPTRRRTV
ncbi:GntR family transcriptional regulator [Phytoactinopolyspora endophytica]|uniref:GntR family transcriptional regulator n=1 Tax=Phytoactinopolyspora endophytica TaxID=1642495 RepID=UPI00197C3237|nr:GntR family transcriptional regulator [Phytoactinopolyspora endophytica]